MHGCRAWLAKGGDLDLRKPGLLCPGEGRGGGRGGRAGEVRDVKQLSPDYLIKRINSNQSLWQGGGGRQSPHTAVSERGEKWALAVCFWAGHNAADYNPGRLVTE